MIIRHNGSWQSRITEYRGHVLETKLIRRMCGIIKFLPPRNFVLLIANLFPNITRNRVIKISEYFILVRLKSSFNPLSHIALFITKSSYPAIDKAKGELQCWLSIRFRSF